MAKNANKVSGRMLFVWFMLAGLIFYFAPPKITNKFQFGFIRIFHKPLSIGRNMSLFASRLMASERSMAEDVVSRERYNRLHNHLANVTEWLKQERQKVEKLSGLRDRPVWKGVDFVLADVIAASVNGMRGELIINRGQKDGLTKGQFILANESIIGTIYKVDNRTAQIKLISDPTSEMAVKIANFNMDRIMHGDGNCSAKVKLVPTKYSIKVSDIVYAQKRPGFLSLPVIVGTVAECKSNDENPLVWDITVQPVCDIKSLTDVAVIVMNPQN
ncbi:MAG: rod shape-determining protein MreC [Planctomycetota bacterium]|jgi:rod shape-determining protein MreC